LTRSIPNLKFNALVGDWNSLGPELNAYGDIVGGSGFILDELQHNARLSNSYS